MASGAPGVPAKRFLPAKEAALFKELLSLYEAHQLKKAQKTADQILKKFPEHGETLAMKGLVTFQSGKREDGLDLIRKGIRFDLTSHIVWHVFGLAKKQEKDYEEAAKSYQQALRYEKDNINILRDASNLHMQLRSYETLEEVRLSMLRLRPNQRQNWIGLAVAYHKAGNLREAKRILETYEDLLKNIPENDVEHSEVLLYHVRLLEELKEYSAALELLELNRMNRRTMDPLLTTEILARLNTKLKKQETADSLWRECIDLNPDNSDYYIGFMANCGIDMDKLTPSTRTACLEHLLALSKRYPRASTIQRLVLAHTTDQMFSDAIKAFLIQGFSRGVPSLFVDIKFLLKDKNKSEAIYAIALSIKASSEAKDDDPTVNAWALYFLAQYASHMGDHDLALARLATLEAHSPTLPELFTMRAKILKRAGDPHGAAEAMEVARVLDGQDRYLNWKAAKYLLRAGKCQEAETIMGLFTKKDAPSPVYDLEEMQCLEYLTEEGDAYYQLGDMGMALKRFRGILKIFSDIEDDQYDFHSYALRKSTLNSYLGVLSWEDRLHENDIYLHSALQASRIYIWLHDTPASERQNRVAKKNARKIKRGAGKPHDKTHDTKPKGATENGAAPTVYVDEDPNGDQLLSVSDPLEQAAALLRRFESAAASCIDFWLVNHDVAIRRRKVLLAIRVFKKCITLSPDNPDLHLRLIEFREYYSKMLASTHDEESSHTLQSFLQAQFPEDLSTTLYNSLFLQRHPQDALAIWAAARAECQAMLPSQSLRPSLIDDLLDAKVKLDLKGAIRISGELAKIDPPMSDSFDKMCSIRFPLATIFSHHDDQGSLVDGSERNAQEETQF